MNAPLDHRQSGGLIGERLVFIENLCSAKIIDNNTKSLTSTFAVLTHEKNSQLIYMFIPDWNHLAMC